MEYVEVAFPLAVDRLFTYAVPDNLRDRVGVGSAVLAPFRNRRRTGYVVAETETPPPKALKEIEGTVGEGPILDPEILALSRWIADYYLCPWGEVLRAAAPKASAVAKREVWVKPAADAPSLGAMADQLVRRAPRQARALHLLCERPEGMRQTELRRASGIAGSSLRRLIESGAVTTFERGARGTAAESRVSDLEEPPTPTSDQAAALEIVVGALREGRRETVLLHGVTGSGKTEVYLMAIAESLAMGRGAIALVPEIALTPQTASRFTRRFGSRVAVIHSRLSAGERGAAWRSIAEGKCDVVVGPRSAVFAPVRHLGLVVIDEEHDASYKQSDANPRYHARDVALERSRLSSASLILGSATPSLESYLSAQHGVYRLATLPSRIGGRPLPRVEIVDMRNERGVHAGTAIGARLCDAIADRLLKKEQAIMLLNRRGFSNYLQCRTCGHVIRCQRCSVSLTYHRTGPALRCHYCGLSERPPDECPECHGTFVGGRGTGTQAVEDELGELFPRARVLRFDADTTRRKGAHRDHLERFGRGEADILLGTQMIAKGLDFPRVTLVGVVSADTALNLPDFRAAERTFQLLAQVAGRTGRSELGGEVIIQSYAPDHYAVDAVRGHRYAEFVQQELRARQELDYPPFSRMALLRFRAPDEERVSKACEAVAETLAGIIGGQDRSDISILGPAPAPIARLRGAHRWHIIVKGKDIDHVRSVVREARKRSDGFRVRGVRVAIDIDPIEVL